MKRRLLVALDPSPASLELLEEAVRLAHALDAELEAVFVEDLDLLRASSFAFVREIAVSGGDFPVASARIERMYRERATVLERAAREASARHAVPVSFRVLRDHVARALLELAAQADLLVLGRATEHPSPRTLPGSTARELARRSSRTVLLLGGRAEGPVAIVHDGGALGDRALEMALEMPTLRGRPLLILVPLDRAEELGRSLKGRLTDRPHEIRAFAEGTLPRMLARFGVSALLLPATHVEALEDLLHATRGAVVVVRE